MNGFDIRNPNRVAERLQLLHAELKQTQESKQFCSKQLEKATQLTQFVTAAAPAVPSASARSGEKRAAEAPVEVNAKRQKLTSEWQKREAPLWTQCNRILSALRQNKNAVAFLEPVDPIKLGIPDYFNVIKHPMDLKTIGSKLGAEGRVGKRRVYQSPLEFRDDVRLVWSNCLQYNTSGPVRKVGVFMQEYFETRWKQSGIESKWAEELKKRQMEEQVLWDSSAVAQRLRELDDKLRSALDTRRTDAQPGPGGIMTFEQKRKLSIQLGSLPQHRLAGLLEVLASSVAVISNNREEVEINLELLDNSTLWGIYAYVNNTTSDQHAKQGAAPQQPNATVSGDGRAATANAAHGNETAAAAAEDEFQPSSSSSSSGSDSSSSSGDSDSAEEVASKDNDNVGSTLGGDPIMDARRQQSAMGDGAEASALVSATRPHINQPSAILKHTSSKKEIALENPNAWADLANDADMDAEENGGTDNHKDEKANSEPDALWSEFQSREQKQQQRDQERKQEEDRLRQERQKAEEEAKREAERLKAQKEAEERAKEEALERERQAEIKLREERKAQELAELDVNEEEQQNEDEDNMDMSTEMFNTHTEDAEATSNAQEYDMGEEGGDGNDNDNDAEEGEA